MTLPDRHYFPSRRTVLSKTVDLALHGHKLEHGHTMNNWDYVYGTHRDEHGTHRTFTLFTWRKNEKGEVEWTEPINSEWNIHEPIGYQQAILMINRNWKLRSKEFAHWSDYAKG